MEDSSLRQLDGPADFVQGENDHHPPPPSPSVRGVHSRNHRDVFFEPPSQAVGPRQDELSFEWFRANIKPRSRLYETRTHRQLLSFLLGKARALIENRFYDQRGTACNLIVGAKGIGKTAVMTIFADAAKFVFPRLAVMYISFNNTHRPLLINELLANELRVHCNLEVRTDSSSHSLGEAIVDALCENNLHLMLLVDELDELYRLDPSIAPWASRNLGTLAYLGNQPSGMISTLICGSSSMLEDLIAVNGKAVLVGEFPLLRTAISLNETKFKSRRVHSTLPTDLEAVSSICGIPNDSPESLARLRAIAFFSGCTARSVQAILTENELTSEAPPVASPENSLPANCTLNNVEISILRRKITEAMVKKNRALLSTLLGRGQLTVEEVARNVETVAWERAFLPLSYSEVEAIWRKMISKGSVASEHRGNLHYNVLHLSDRLWITFSGVKDGHPDLIYPPNLNSLFKFIMDQKSYPHFEDRLLKNVIPNGAKVYSTTMTSPRVLVVASTITVPFMAGSSCSIS